MVNHVVTREELTEFTLNMAKRIARQPLLALRCTKEAVNNAQDAAGRTTVMNAQFALHQLGHAHNQQEFGILIDGNSDAAKMSKAAMYKK
jgi:enoyl-CoA hydratase